MSQNKLLRERDDMKRVAAAVFFAVIFVAFVSQAADELGTYREPGSSIKKKAMHSRAR